MVCRMWGLCVPSVIVGLLLLVVLVATARYLKKHNVQLKQHGSYQIIFSSHFSWSFPLLPPASSLCVCFTSPTLIPELEAER